MNAATTLTTAAAVLGLAAATAQAKSQPNSAAPPAALGKVLECRGVSEAAARLACFDAAVASLDRAVTGGEVAVVDREQIRQTKRGLFGFSVSDLPLFGKRDRGAAEQDEVKEISGVLRSVSSNANGHVFTLEDGARWEQTDALTLGRTPRVGDAVTIKRMALGSYKISFKIGPSMKVRRIG